MTCTTKGKSEFVFTGKHMALSMVAFFGVIITVNITMATLASTSWTGLVVKNSYVASQHFNDELVQAKAQRDAGLTSDVSYQNGVLTFIMKDKDGTAIEASQLIAEIGRPAFEQADHSRVFVSGEDFAKHVSLDLEAGLWSIKITGKSAGISYRRDTRIFVDARGGGRLE